MNPSSLQVLVHLLLADQMQFARSITMQERALAFRITLEIPTKVVDPSVSLTQIVPLILLA